jgi:hypothetical protein
MRRTSTPSSKQLSRNLLLLTLDLWLRGCVAVQCFRQELYDPKTSSDWEQGKV